MSTARTVAAVGLFSSGLTAGLALAYPLLINDLWLRAEGGIPAKHRLHLWDRAYHNGAAVMPLLALMTTATTLSSALLLDGPVAQQRSAVVSALLTLSIIPFTLIAIMPLNKVLIQMRKDTNAEFEPKRYTNDEVTPLLNRWVRLHNVRVALTSAGFALSILSWLDVYRL